MEKDNFDDERSPSTSIAKYKSDIETSPRILFASDTRGRHRHDEITTLPLTRTFSRNTYSSALEDEEKRVRRAAAGKAPEIRFPTGSLFIKSLMQSIVP
jgi:hypothetical protein